MDVGRPHRVPVKDLEDLSCGAIRWERVGCWLQTVEVIVPVPICPKLPAEVVVGLVGGILEVIFAVRRRLPDVDDSIGNGPLGYHVCDLAMHERDLSFVRTHYDAIAILAERGVGAPEWAEDCVGGGTLICLQGVIVIYLDH